MKDQARKIHFSGDAIECLMQRKWPGNVRELRNLVDRVVVFADSDTVKKEDIQAIDGKKLNYSTVPNELRVIAKKIIGLELKNKLKSIEDALIEEAMLLTENNKSAAARLLGTHRKSIERRVENLSHEHSPRHR